MSDATRGWICPCNDDLFLLRQVRKAGSHPRDESQTGRNIKLRSEGEVFVLRPARLCLRHQHRARNLLDLCVHNAAWSAVLFRRMELRG